MTALPAHLKDLFDRARGATTIADQCGVKLSRAGRERRGPCPGCGAGGRSGSGPFAVAIATDTFRTYCGCGKRGDVIDLVAWLRGESLVQAANWILGGAAGPVVARAKARPEKPEGPTSGQKIWTEMWAGSRPIGGTLAERYLLSRGILPAVVEAASARLRYHPFAKVMWNDRAREWVKAPAMLAQVETPDGPTGGGHATYLLRDGTGRDKRRGFGKRMWGPQWTERPDGTRVQGGAWLIGPGSPEVCDGGPLVDAEGIETSLSLVSLVMLKTGRLRRACAALSLDRLQGGVVTDADGVIDLNDPQPDPERAPFTWPRPVTDPWDEVLVGLDRDMSPIRAKGRTGRGRLVPVLIEGEARARLCGRLATAAWARAGSPARAIAPPPRMDFNDELRRVLAHWGAA